MAKRIDADGTVHAVRDETWFRAESVPVADFTALAELLTLAAQDGTLFAVRGRIRAGVDTERMRRMHRNDAEAPSLEPAEHHWLMLDLDSWRPDVPAAEFAADPRAWAERARAALPEPFRGAACWYQATGSAGIKPGVRLRLAFWLSRPIGDSDAKAWVRSWASGAAGSGAPAFDLAIYTPSQPAYLATPLFCDAPDPVRARTGVLAGAQEVPVPLVLVPAQSEAYQELERAARLAKRAKDGERRNTLNRLAFGLAARFPEAELPDAVLHATLLEAHVAGGGVADTNAQRTLDEAIADGRGKYSADRAGWRAGLALDKHGAPRGTAANVSLILEHHETWRGVIAWDERALRPIWLKPSPWAGAGRPVDEADEVRLIEWFQRECWIDARPQWIRGAVTKCAHLHAFDPVRDYLAGVPEWDGEPRADSLLIRHLGVPDSPLTRRQTACWLLQAYRRAFATAAAPVQADYVIVLHGETGLRKSDLVASLSPSPRFYLARLPDMHTKDAQSALADAWIVELAELTHRRADRDTVKAFITARVDKFRKAYGRDELEVPRRCVLIGTTNEAEFLTDPTGNRRFWPMRCTRRAAPNAVAGERDQLWAEVRARAEAGELAYLEDAAELEAQRVQAEHMERDPIQDVLERALRAPAPLGAFQSDLGWDSGQLGPAREIRTVRLAQACSLAGMDVRSPLSVRRVREALRLVGWVFASGTWTAPEGWEYKIADKAIEKRSN